MLRLALPLIVMFVSQYLKTFIDTVLTGRIGPREQGAVGLGSSLFFFGASFGIGAAIGADPLISQAFGAGRPREARRTMWHGILTAVLAFVPASALVLAAAQFLESFGVKPELAAVTREYIHHRIASFLPLFALFVVRGYLQAAHRTGVIVLATAVGTSFHFALESILLFGDRALERVGLPAQGLPLFGIRGAAWSITLATALELLLISLAVRRIDPGAGETPLRRIDAAKLRRVCAIGIPAGLSVMAEGGIITILGVLIGGMGVAVAAAHQVALSLASLTFMVSLSLSTATSVQVGRAIGRRDPAGTRRAGVLGISLAGGFMAFTALALWTFPSGLAGWMTSDPEVIPLASKLILIAGAFQVFDGVQCTSSGALRGAGITRWTLGANLTAYFLVALPVGALLAYPLRMGAEGLWWGLTIGIGIVALSLAWKFARISSRPIEPQEITPPAD